MNSEPLNAELASVPVKDEDWARPSMTEEECRVEGRRHRLEIIREMRFAFLLLDTDADGFITGPDLSLVRTAHGLSTLTDAQASVALDAALPLGCPVEGLSFPDFVTALFLRYGDSEYVPPAHHTKPRDKPVPADFCHGAMRNRALGVLAMSAFTLFCVGPVGFTTFEEMFRGLKVGADPGVTTSFFSPLLILIAGLIMSALASLSLLVNTPGFSSRWWVINYVFMLVILWIGYIVYVTIDDEWTAYNLMSFMVTMINMLIAFCGCCVYCVSMGSKVYEPFWTKLWRENSEWVQGAVPRALHSEAPAETSTLSSLKRMWLDVREYYFWKCAKKYSAGSRRASPIFVAPKVLVTMALQLYFALISFVLFDLVVSSMRDYIQQAEAADANVIDYTPEPALAFVVPPICSYTWALPDPEKLNEVCDFANRSMELVGKLVAIQQQAAAAEARVNAIIFSLDDALAAMVYGGALPALIISVLTILYSPIAFTKAVRRARSLGTTISVNHERFPPPRTDRMWGIGFGALVIGQTVQGLALGLIFLLFVWDFSRDIILKNWIVWVSLVWSYVVQVVVFEKGVKGRLLLKRCWEWNPRIYRVASLVSSLYGLIPGVTANFLRLFYWATLSSVYIMRLDLSILPGPWSSWDLAYVSFAGTVLHTERHVNPFVQAVLSMLDEESIPWGASPPFSLFTYAASLWTDTERKDAATERAAQLNEELASDVRHVSESFEHACQYFTT